MFMLWQMAIPEFLVNCFDGHILLAVLCILFSPFYWNVVRLLM